MTKTYPRRSLIILILGALTALSPFSIDMYLSAFPDIAESLQTTVAKISLTLSSYFVGLAFGQLIYGPLLDRFGRKPPLHVGLAVYVLASIGCLTSHSVESLTVFRFLQALGGCAANVTAMAMVRDLFSVKESAKVFSLLILILGASPLLAPTIGSYISLAFGWHAVFAILMGLALLLTIVVFFFLPESHVRDPSITLKPGSIMKNYLTIFKDPQFYTYTLAGAFAFSGLFVYVAGSPLIFLKIFKVSPQVYGWIFAGLSVGFIGASQLNIFLLRYFRNERILKTALIVQSITGIFFLAGTLQGGFGFEATIALLFILSGSIGFANPNAAAMALAPFKTNAGRAAALMGFLQMGIGAAASVGIGLVGSETILPTAAILAASGTAGLTVLLCGTKNIILKTGSSDSIASPSH